MIHKFFLIPLLRYTIYRIFIFRTHSQILDLFLCLWFWGISTTKRNVFSPNGKKYVITFWIRKHILSVKWPDFAISIDLMKLWTKRGTKIYEKLIDLIVVCVYTLLTLKVKESRNECLELMHSNSVFDINSIDRIFVCFVSQIKINPNICAINRFIICE